LHKFIGAFILNRIDADYPKDYDDGIEPNHQPVYSF